MLTIVGRAKESSFVECAVPVPFLKPELLPRSIMMQSHNAESLWIMDHTDQRRIATICFLLFLFLIQRDSRSYNSLVLITLCHDPLRKLGCLLVKRLDDVSHVLHRIQRTLIRLVHGCLLKHDQTSSTLI